MGVQYSFYKPRAFVSVARYSLVRRNRSRVAVGTLVVVSVRTRALAANYMLARSRCCQQLVMQCLRTVLYSSVWASCPTESDQHPIVADGHGRDRLRVARQK